ncbi:basement membrane-specific heparan sulfate proteoglycan core protein isoform X21 [Megalobrama amblycephala]|uniref:basement membrane-specific heparan sulfate proteoglycan core protein isoform X21 n=1 Tax=Megalobrama amblycephala TaxID=75352 RepID=UPI00201426CD|nr:basement membrane-specific heparan sulfate proteoglycan core protein isoform X21 [Megalobrama amblycephala]
MGTRIRAHKLTLFIIPLIFTSHLFNVAQTSKVWDEVPFPEDLEEENKRPGGYVDDEEYYDPSGEISGEEDGSTPEPPTTDPPTITVYYRALVNFTNSFQYGPELDDIYSPAFQEISSAVVDTLESDYSKIPGQQTVNVVLIKKIGKDVFVELDVGSDNNPNESQIRGVLFSVVKEGTIASYDTSVIGFQFRRLGEVKPSPRVCLSNEFRCQDGLACIPQDFVCDKRPDCNDLSDEENCVPPVRPTPPTPPKPRPTPGPGPCRADQATCQNGQCISKDYVCDGEPDCTDGSDEFKCGTPSPCEPNEFKCQNGRCALKLWRCDGDNDCQDNSDEMNCPTKGPGDTCAPEQFVCLSDRTCIPASYQCDEEPDCADRSDEYGCAPPVVTNTPEASITAARGETVSFTCSAIGVPIPIITWRLNWGHIPANSRITMTSENGRGTLIIRDVKESDQGAYTCEAINAKGLVFAIPDGVLSLSQRPNPGNCRDGHFSVGNLCMPCFCFGITKNCQSTGRYRSQIGLRFTEEEDFKGVNVSFPSRPGTPPPLSSTQMLINPETEEFQLVDLSRRFLDQDSYWSLPRQFLGNKVDSYGGYLKFKVSYSLQRGGSEPKEKPDVMLSGNGHRFIYRRGNPTLPDTINNREIKFTEENWQHSSGRAVTRDDLMMTLANLESIHIRTIYDNRMASVGLSDISMDTTTKEFSLHGNPREVEECRCPAGYSGLSCESCSPGFERVPGPYLGTCAGCNCNGHANACDPISGHCLSCQHNTEGPQCDKCKPGYFGDPSRGRYDCKPCPCPYTETSRRFSDTCFLDHDNLATCDACRPGYTGRRCDKCAPGYVGNPLQPNGKCVPAAAITKCDNRGTINPISKPCYCKANVVGALCDECKIGSFHLAADNPEGCLQCFCMGVTKQCASSTWSRDHVRGGVNGQLFTLSNAANTRTISEGITQRASAEVVYRSFTSIPKDIYYWVLPQNFRGDKVTAYGGELQYRLRYEPQARSLVIDGQPDVVLQGNGIFLEHYSLPRPLPRVPSTITVPFRESAWRRTDGQPCTREHMLMALADISLFMIRATYADNMAESSISNIQMDIAVPHSTGNERALEVEECACPQGYTGPSCQECDTGYTRTPGLYLGTCEKCDCSGHASGCDSETGDCLNCLHNTVGRRCENCLPGFYGNPKTGDPQACRPCPCLGHSSNQPSSCYLGSDGQPICECPAGYTGRRCERCAPGYTGNPQLGQRCTRDSTDGDCYRCDKSGSEGCSATGICRCKMNVEGSTCSTCKQGTFHLSPANKDGCLSCFCMGVTQQCSSSSHYRDVVSTNFAPGNYQGFALVNRQRTNRIDSGFSVELSTDGTQISYTNFNYLGQEPHYWQLPRAYQEDKKTYSARTRRAHKRDSSWIKEQLRKDVAIWHLMNDMGKDLSRSKRAIKHPADEVRKIDDEIWAIITNFSNGQSPFPFSSSSQTSHSSFEAQSLLSRSSVRAPPFHSGLTSSLKASESRSNDLGHSSDPDSTQQVEQGKNTVGLPRGPRPGPSKKYVLVYSGFSLHPDDVLFWQLPEQFKGDKVGAYGGKLKYTISYVPGPRGSPIEDVDVQIIGNDITLVARQTWRRGQGARESQDFEIVFREEHWQRPDGMPATREHLMMVLADLDDILIRASYHTEMRSSSISGIRMDIAVPDYTGLARALEVEQCQCPPGYRGLSCQDCAPGYTRTGGGLYLGHCEPCECNGHSDSCHPETGICMSCQHNTKGELCEQCADGFFGDPTAGTPEDCQPCACPGTDPDNQFSRTCESLGNGGYQCTACQPGYTGQYCERCASGYFGNPQARIPCRSAAASLVVKVFPERVQVAQGIPVTLRCQVSGYAPHYFYWSREDGRPISSSAERRRQGEELHFPSVQPSDAGVYICTCRDQRSSNRSKAEIVVTTLPSKPIEVFIEEPKAQSVTVGSTVSFICTAKSKLPAYTLVWTRKGNIKLPNRAMDFNGILTIQNVQPEDAGIYVCTGSNMLGMDEGTALLYVPEASQSQMFFTAYEMFEGHRTPTEGAQPVATVNPPVLTIQQGQRAEFRCSVTGNPTPAVEWIGGPGKRISSKAVIRNGLLTIPSVDRSDEGEYICKALNTHGEHTARGVLHVQSTGQPHGLPIVQVSPPRVELHEGETLRLYCRAVGNPTPALTWKKRGGSLPPQAIPSHGFHQFKSNSLDVLQRRIEELQARMERTDIGTLLIPNIRSSDAGTYLCVGTNTVGSSEAYIEVVVKRGEIIPSGVTIQPSIASVMEGETIDLNCIVPGTSPASVKWSRAGGLLSSNHQVLGTQLRILQASADDNGEYICQVEGGPSPRQASVSVSVTSSSSRLQSPIISIEPHSAAVKQGDSASFRCRVHSGAQPVRLEWKPTNNQPLPDNVKIGPDNSVMTITNAQAKNQGTYRCVASNLFGMTHSIVSLIVRESPKAVVTPAGPVRVRVGDPINLECQAAGEPRPSVRWHRLDNNRRTMLSSPVPSDSSAIMQVLVARPEDSGTYVCTAQNNQGTTETRVEVFIEGGPQVPTVPRASVREPMIVVVEGSTATLHCDAHGFPKPTITWSKERSSLPWRHKIVDNSLVLPNVGRQDSGQYVCNATNHMGTSEVTVMLEVDTPPYATSLPDDVSVRVGEVIRLQCLAHGTPPLRYEWTKVNGSLPQTAQLQGGDLQINLAKENDAGTYKCVASNKVGKSEALAKVSVRSPLSVKVSPQVEVKALGSAVEFTCAAKGGSQIEIEWLKEGGVLPPNHHIKDGVLRIENLEQSNEGIYTCRATSLFGQAQDSAKLTIQALPKVKINVRTSVQTVMVGNSVEFECHAIGDPEPTVRWSKVGGSLPDHVEVRGNILRIDQVTESDSGQYRCTATNNVGSEHSHVVLNIQSLPQIAAQPEAKEVTVGSDAVLPCIASGYPVPTITWSKVENELPSKCRQDGHVLTVPGVTHTDAGTYVCTAANKQGKVEAFTRLNVHERVMPYFTQEPLSYLTLPTIKNSYKAFSIKITFRPDNVDGLILYAGMIIYNGQKKTTGADFISFGLVGGRPEFRFDVGSGMATIRYPTSIKLGEFHTVQLYRNQTQGSLIVDGEAPINGSSQGKFKGLDLNEELFVGGYPNYSMLAKTADLKTGFVGCIKQLIIQGDEVIFKDLDKSSTGVSNCPTCKDRPCQNGGVCVDSVASLYKCNCQRGFTGSNCQHHSSLHCHTEACGPDATCINRPSGSGYDCRCHLGKSGVKCMDGTLVTTPLFNGDESYIAYPPLTNIHNDLRIEMEFKPMDVDGLMFFSGGKKMKVEDFVALSMVDGHVEFRYELGTGQAVLRSQDIVSLGQWHRVVAERLNKDGSLKVDHAREITRSSPGKAQGLNIHTPMYLGGVPSMDILPKPANVSMLFDGCIGEVFINGKKVDLSYSFTESRAIIQCTDGSPCDRRPCLNGGTCMPSAEYEYQCLCAEGYEGDRCEIVRDTCRDSSQCQNGGSCVNNQCVCLAGYTGRHCEKGQESSFTEALWNLEGSGGNDSPIEYSAYFHNNGYLALPKPMFPRSAPDSPETIELEINTVSKDGLILWQGVETAGALNLRKKHASIKELGHQGKGKDFISLGLQNGHLVFSYQLGSGEAQILSREPVNDGQWHMITAVRTGKQGYLQIDGGSVQRGQSQGKSIMVNTKGNIYLGGAPDMKALTGGKYSSGITGCVRNLSLMNARPGEQPARPIDLQVHAEEGINVERCLT